MIASSVKFLHAGDTALVVEFGEHIDRDISARVLALAARVERERIPGVAELVPTFRSLMVHYEPLILPHATLKQKLSQLLSGLGAAGQTGRRWRIPVCFDAALGEDLAEVASRTGLSVAHCIEEIAATTFHVYMLGFLPGFPYMGGLPKTLELPRRDNPRIKVPRGSLAIAMTMAAIYPMESPGGWHLLGRTPLEMWDMRFDPPALLAAGDQAMFHPITVAEFETLAARIEAGTYRLAPEAASSGAASA